MIVIRPLNEEGDDDSWQGSVNQITSITKRQNNDLEKRISKKTDKLEVGFQKQLKLSQTTKHIFPFSKL